MGIPRFYKWLKNRYPLIRLDLSDKQKQLPIIDHFYIDFNALVYQCIRQSNCFLRNKIKPLSFEQIYQRVFDYLINLINVVNPQDLIFIALDGVAPRAKINQSRDRRFKGSKDDQSFQRTIMQIGIQNKQNFLQNSISPGTKFLNDLCGNLKQRVLKQMQQNFKHLKVFFSDCCVPGQGEHKIMQFLRYTRNYKVFSQKTTYCVYSPDADVILLTLSLGIENICLIKQDTSVNPSPNWTATSVYRKTQPKQFQFVMINILRQYFKKQFKQILTLIPDSTIQQILDDLILLMAFVGNDFLPLQFCFTLKDNHIENLIISYKTYLEQNKDFINKRGKIDWSKIYKLLQIAKKFEAQMIEEMINKKRQKGPKRLAQQMDGPSRQKDNGHNNNGSDAQQYSAVQDFQIKNNTITKGRDKYYLSRFGIEDIHTDVRYKNIIQSYIQGLQFYCEYYYLGLPSWTWYYPYHYTPMLIDVYEYLNNHKVNIVFPKSEPFEPFLALMFMVSLKSVELLPLPLQNQINDKTKQLRAPLDYFPTNFALDKFQTLKYNKRALIQFLDQKQVRKVYKQIPKNAFSADQLKRNQHKNNLLFYYDSKSNKVQSLQVILNLLVNLSESDLALQKQVQKVLKQFFKKQNKQKDLILRQRFPNLENWWGTDYQFSNGKIITKNKYRYNGNPGEIVLFNNFLGMIEDTDNTNQSMKKNIEMQYLKYGIQGKCDFYYTIKRLNYVREINRFCLMSTKKQVIVPDFAITKPPNYDYIKKTQNSPSEKHYQIGELVSILNAKHFGYQGIIQKITNKTAQVRLIKGAIHSDEKVQQIDEPFYTVNYVLNHLQIQYETLLAIMNEIIILPQFNKKKQSVSQLLPNEINFSLNIIDVRRRLIVPRFVRCQVQYDNYRKPNDIFRRMEISKTCLDNLQKYIQKFDWLVNYIQDQVEKKQYQSGKYIYSRIIFSQYQNPNLKMYKEFIQLYEFDNQGSFYSIYSKIALNYCEFKYLSLSKKQQQRVISIGHNQIISRKQGKKCPPALKCQPQYHNIGDKVILLSNLQTGYIYGIDDNIFHIAVGLNQKHYRVRFHQIFNQHWSGFLAIQQGKGWNLESSYYSPSYWNKAIDLQQLKQQDNQPQNTIITSKEQKIQSNPSKKLNSSKNKLKPVGQEQEQWSDVSEDIE